MRILPLKFLIQSLFLLFFPIYFCYRRLNEPFVQKTMKGSKLLFNIISKSFHYKLNWTNTINYLFPKKMGLIVKIKKKVNRGKNVPFQINHFLLYIQSIHPFTSINHSLAFKTFSSPSFVPSNITPLRTINF